jgi:hypothetical protein
MTKNCLTCGILLTGYHFNSLRCVSCAKLYAKELDRKNKNIELAKDAIECPVCHIFFNVITAGHYKKHGFSTAQQFKEACNLPSLTAESIRQKQAEFMQKESPTKGKQRTTQEKELMSKNRSGKGMATCGKYIRTPEIRSAISKGVAEFHLMNPDHRPDKFYKAERVYCEKAQTDVWVRSSWERRVVQILDQYAEIEKVQIEPFRIAYMFDGVLHNYIPDFLIIFEGGVKEIWEVKPEEFISLPRNKAKIEALKTFTNENKEYDYRIVTLKDIEKMEYKTRRNKILNLLIFNEKE